MAAERTQITLEDAATGHTRPHAPLVRVREADPSASAPGTSSAVVAAAWPGWPGQCRYEPARAALLLSLQHRLGNQAVQRVLQHTRAGTAPGGGAPQKHDLAADRPQRDDGVPLAEPARPLGDQTSQRAVQDVSAALPPAQGTVIQRLGVPTHFGRSPTVRKLTGPEDAAAKQVFGTALKTEDIVLTEAGDIDLTGGYARTVPEHIYFPLGAFSRSDFMPWLIHELTHVWQYQRGGGWGDLPGMIWEAVVGIYDYGGEAGLREAWRKGQAFAEFTTEQQGDILSDYYVRLMTQKDVSAYQPYVDQVKTGREHEHHYPKVEPLEAGHLDVGKLNEEYRQKTEAELVRELRVPMVPNDPRAVARADRLVELFRHLTPYWSGDYAARIAARRSDDVLVQLLYAKLSRHTRERIFMLLGVDKSLAE